MGYGLKFILALLALTVANPARAQSLDWVVSDAAGSVSVVEEGKSQPVHRGAHIIPGAVLVTGMSSRAVVTRGHDFVTVSANSRVRIPTAAQKQGLLEIVLEWGNSIFQIEKQTKPHFAVQTPYLAAVVKGTTFSITVTELGASLQVVEGVVETSTLDGDAKDLIRPGMVASVERADIYRLTIDGQETRQIGSPARGGAAPVPAAPVLSPSPASSATQRETSEPAVVDTPVVAASTVNEASGPQIGSQLVAETISSNAVDLGRATGGVIAGTNSVEVASVDVAVTRASVSETDNSGADSNGNHDAKAGSNHESASPSAAISENTRNGWNDHGSGNGSSGSESSGKANAGSDGSKDGGNEGGNGNSGSNSGSNDNTKTSSEDGQGSGNDRGNGNGGSGSGNNGNANAGSTSDKSGNTDLGVASGNDHGNGNGNGNGDSAVDGVGNLIVSSGIIAGSNGRDRFSAGWNSDSRGNTRDWSDNGSNRGNGNDGKSD